MVDAQGFQFRSTGYLEELTGKKAKNLDELAALIRSSSDSSIFYHTFSALRKMREIHAPYTNDFALWISRCLGDEALSEKLGAINLREYNTIKSLRTRISEIIEGHRDQNTETFTRQAEEPFYLCDVTKIVYLTDEYAYDLKSFLYSLERVPNDSVYYHFIESRIRSELHLDDFSNWIAGSLGLDPLAEKIRNVDIMVNTLTDIRTKIWSFIEAYLNASPLRAGPTGV